MCCHCVESTCWTGQKLHYLANDQGKHGRNSKEAEQACQNRETEVPGAQLKDCVNKMIHSLLRTRCKKLLPGLPPAIINFCVFLGVRGNPPLAWVRFHTWRGSVLALANNGESYSLTQKYLPFTICKSG